MNTQENKKYYTVLISVLLFFLLLTLYFVINLVVNGTNFPLFGGVNNLLVDNSVVAPPEKVGLLTLDKKVLESDKFKELTFNSRYEFSTSTLKIGKSEPFSGFGEK